jgi:HD superfamily phosphohydrolase
MHDIGHGPFSHATEELIERYTRSAMMMLKNYKKGEISDVLGSFTIAIVYCKTH